MDVTRVVAANVRAIREQKKLTLDAAAELTGVSRSMLAQLEKGDVNPTISVLWKIANGYKVSCSSLLEGKKAGGSVEIHRQDEASTLLADEGRYINYPTFTFDEKRLFECYRIVIHKGGELHAQPHLAGAEEYITVFSGSVEITVDGEVYRLEHGDSIRFRADVAHGYRSVSAGDVELNMIIYYAK